MATGYFVVQNGLQVGPLTIDAATGTINTSGDVSITGNLGVSQISKNDSSVKINDTGSGSNIVFTVDGGVEHTMTGPLTTLNGNLLLNDVGYVQVPAGNTAQRPGTPAAGMIRYNSTLSSFEGYGTAWASLGGVKSVDGLTFIQAETSPGASNDELEFFVANGASTTTREVKVDQYAMELNGNLYISPVTNGVNQAKLWSNTAGLTDADLVVYSNVNSFAQSALHNHRTGSSASTDFIAYADRSDNLNGFIDMGIASTTFSDPAYGVTNAGDGYIFLNAPKYANTTATGGNLVLATADGVFGDIVFAAGGFVSGTEQGRFKTNDGLYVSGNLVADGGTIYQGPLAKEFEADAAITDPAGLFTGNIDSFVQVSLHNRNTGGSASADFIAYADTGDNLRGYIDMGIASTTFNDPAFAVTQAGDGYIFVSAPAYGNTAATGGNLVLATADGSWGDIVFAAGGFATGTEQGRFVTNDGLYVTGNVISTDGVVYQGENAKSQEFSANNTATLSTTINAAVTSFTVNSTAGFLNHGVLYVGTELMYYSGKTSNSFTGITRATGGTTAQTHTSGKVIYQPISGLTNASAIFVGDANDFVQFALKNLNSGSGASTDLIAYASNGDNDSGWIDVGITGENFDDPDFGVTGRDDGYIFMSAPKGTPGNGDLFISTDGTGKQNDIVFSTGGFADSTFERLRIIGQSRAGKPAGVEIYIPTTSTSTSTGALRVQGGVGIQGNLNVGGNFNLTGNITIGGTGSTTSTSTLVVENPINFLANANTGDAQDIGVVGQYVSGGTKYAGLVRDSVSKSFRFFDGLTTKPTTTVSWSGTTAANVYMGQLTVANATASTTTTTGAAVIIGGLGVGGRINAGGDVNFSSNTQASNDTTGALRVKGGISIETGSLYAGGAAGVAVNARGDIVPTANLTYNLGSTTAWWNTLYGVSTQARYADLAENYQADAQYEPGTVLEFGGEAEVTIATDGTKRVAGVVSTNPAHLMNGSLQGRNVVPLALQGRVPCKVIGPVAKGDLMVSAGFGYAKTNNDAATGQVIGKALADFTGAKGVIEVVVGRL